MEQEGNIALQKDFYKDAEYQVKAYQEGRRNRHLYVVPTYIVLLIATFIPHFSFPELNES